MPQLMRLPAYQMPDNALLNFAPVNQAFAAKRQSDEQDRQYGIQQEQLGLQKQTVGLQQQKFAQEQENEVKRRVGNLALLTLQAPPDQQQTRWQQIMALHPDAAALVQKNPAYGDHRTGPLALLADAGMAPDYLSWQMKQQEAARAAAADQRATKVTDAQLAQYKNATPEARAGAAQQYGLQPGTPEFQSFVLQGTLPAQRPVDAVTQHAILDADKGAQASQTAIQSLRQAIELSSKSYSGIGAETRGAITDAAVPWNTPEATNTVRLRQLVTSQALDQLRQIFGGNPTEGERKILLDIQGSVSQSAAAREAIWRNAIAAVEARQAQAQSQSAMLRSGGYFKPGGNAGVPSAGALSAPASAAPAAKAPHELSDDEIKANLGLR